MAREQGLTEDQVTEIEDGYEESDLSSRDKAAIALTDAIIGDPRQVTPEVQARLREHFSDPEIVEMALGVGLFMSLSKVLITLGMEPEEMGSKEKVWYRKPDEGREGPWLSGSRPSNSWTMPATARSASSSASTGGRPSAAASSAAASQAGKCTGVAEKPCMRPHVGPIQPAGAGNKPEQARLQPGLFFLIHTSRLSARASGHC